MPAYLTHYSCGVCAFHRLPEGELKQAIRDFPHSYSMGLAGPDLFFYSLGEWLPWKEGVGRTMHRDRTGDALERMLDTARALPPKERGPALAYTAGFLGHYALDTCCHPLVFGTTRRGGAGGEMGRHYRFEAAMDAASCERVLKRPIGQSHQMALIRLTRRERTAIAGLLADVLFCAYPEKEFPGRHHLSFSLREYYFFSGLLIDPSGFREWLLLGCEKVLFGHAAASPLFINGNTYGVSDPLTDRFFRRFGRGVDRHVKLLTLTQEWLEHPEQPEIRGRLRAAVGNRSYHSGRDLDSVGNRSCHSGRDLDSVGNRSCHSGRDLDPVGETGQERDRAGCGL